MIMNDIFPWIEKALIIIGALRLVFKPIMESIQAHVKATPDTWDDEQLDRIEASAWWKWASWIIDWITSIKIGPQFDALKKSKQQNESEIK